MPRPLRLPPSYGFTVLALLVPAVAGGCGRASQPAVPASDVGLALAAVRPEPAGDRCPAGGLMVLRGLDADGDLRLVDAEVQVRDLACHDAAPAAGDPLQVAIIQERLAPGAACSSGGLQLRWGTDRNRNQRLDPAEFEGNAVLCNGKDGKDGKDGNGDGKDGKDGKASGLVTLFRSEPSPAGGACLAGGTKLSRGLDRNGNGLLDAAEVEATDQVCNGLTGPGGRPALVRSTRVGFDAACPAGAVLFEHGVDQDGDHLLSGSEIDGRNVVCDGAPGVPGPAGADGRNALLRTRAIGPGTDCAAGGVALDFGVDDDRDGVLSDGEVDGTSFVCHLAPTADAGADLTPDTGNVQCDPTTAALPRCDLAGVFVHADGLDDEACGLDIARPCRTITRGLVAARDAARPTVYVAAGFYAESITLQSGISLRGGWDASWNGPTPGSRAILLGRFLPDELLYATVRGRGVQNVLLDHFLIEGPAVVGAGDGRGSYAVHLIDSTDVVFRNVVVRGGQAGPGSPGAPGPQGASGTAGAAGGFGGAGSGLCDDQSRGFGGGGGASFCGSRGGNGGPGGTADTMCNGFLGDLQATAGLPGASTSGSAGGEGGRDCASGANGVSVAPGMTGAAGMGGGRSLLVGLEYLGESGGSGSPGTDGEGAGGGGGGGGCDNSSDDFGPGGGGGGGGGCFGLAGQGGTGGGASVGVFLLRSRFTITDATVTLGAAGAGGAGGAGGLGGSGGAGGGGGVRASVRGGVGGNGGRGGDGGPGGGGAGGASAGVLLDATSILVHERVSFEGGAAGAGGMPGGGPGSRLFVLPM